MKELHVKKTVNGNTIEYTLKDDDEAINAEMNKLNTDFGKVFDEMFQERKKMFEGFFEESLFNRLFPLKTLEIKKEERELPGGGSEY